MRRRVMGLAVSAALVFAGISIGAAGAKPASFSHLNPGGKTSLHEQVPVNVVFVGYEPGQIRRARFLSKLPERYRPQIRSLFFYGLDGDLGISYRYDYGLTFTGKQYENQFFSALKALSTPADLTFYQQQYNDQDSNVLNVKKNHFIDAPSVERWLIHHPPAGVDTREDTVFFINWWGRSDFEFHVYTKTNEPDPDTGFNFGSELDSRKIIAWGGTSSLDEEDDTGSAAARRVWFYDLSAGPEFWTDNWNVDDPDLDGDGEVEYRMPPIWEYRKSGGFRAAKRLTGDLAKITRFVAIDLLFTTSPLYAPALTPPRMPQSLNLDLNIYEAWPGVDVSATYIKPGLLDQEEGELLRIPTSVDRQDLKLAGKARSCFMKWVNSVPCYPKRTQYPDPFANLFLYHAINRERFTDGGGQYEATVFAFGTDPDVAGNLLGYADDNWFDGTQSSVFTFTSPELVEFGYGLTTTMIHEVGHHLGMSHPHDGYDFETGQDFGAGGSFYYSWSGDESNTVMSYLDFNADFSQFDLDNHWRTTAASYLINVNAIAASVLASTRSSDGLTALHQADVEVGRTKAAFRNHAYGAAFDHARAALGFAKKAAADAGVKVRASQKGWFVLPPVHDDEAVGKLRGYAYRDRIGPATKRGGR